MKTKSSIIFGLLTLLIGLLANQSFAQLDEDYETLLLEEEETQDVFNTVFKPIIGVGQGMFTFMGDIKGDYPFNPANGYWGTKAVISRTFGKSFEFDLFFMFGKFGGQQIGYAAETTPNPIEDNIEDRLLNSTNKNFYTDVTVSGLNFTYNFIGPFGRKRPILPYISLGIETLQFRPKTDIIYTDANGNDNPYHYWSDGTIRTQSEGTDEPSVVINRDYEYETDARNATGQDYSFFSLAVPIEVGANVTITDRMTLRLGSSIHISFTDYLDNYSNGESVMDNDFFNYTYASLRFDMFSPAEEIIAVENFKNIKFIDTDNEDQDGDGVDDFNDYCPDTEPGIKVDFRGCPLDSDRDGVPDYRDQQHGTIIDALGVNEKGIRILDMHVISMLYEPEAVKRKDIYNYYRGSDEEKVEYDEIPAKFVPLDENEDGWISPKELQKAINDFFDFKSKLKADDIYELKEFFFHQK
ncbi:MAG: hypothetical protein PF489_10100 [Salinivirgaceae bacterium]|nr:hypothetical protein [Salinivirgaceae bacterium]